MTAKPLPSTAAVTGLKETLDFFNDPSFAQRRFDAYGDVFATKLLAQRIVFIRGERAITELLNQGDSLEGWWPESVKQLLGSRSLANRSGPGHKARRRVVGQLFSSAALVRYTPSITGLINELAHDLSQSPGCVSLSAMMRRFAFAVIATESKLGQRPAGAGGVDETADSSVARQHCQPHTQELMQFTHTALCVQCHSLCCYTAFLRWHTPRPAVTPQLRSAHTTYTTGSSLFDAYWNCREVYCGDDSQLYPGPPHP